jgi:hypothetical protein
VSILADKGFVGTSRFYQNCNDVLTPPLMSGRKVKQHHQTEMGPKTRFCRQRYTSEVAYTRVTKPDSVKDVIPFENIDAFQYTSVWGAAEINLGNPLRKPGPNSGLTQDYFDFLSDN